MFGFISRSKSNIHHKLGRYISSLATIRDTKSPGLLFRLTSEDPYLNLSIEHYIFQHVPLATRVLLFYINRPCIVIGRNQNPWVEINLQLLKDISHETSAKSQILSKVDFVRRRSGGGTVFHDDGNVNWGVICDANEFTRDKHAEMVVRGIQQAGAKNVRVNDRHDIVLESDLGSRPLKVSGSAYKLARGRALHHGTALCQSKNLGIIPEFLRSPAKSFITAKGVDSVRSPITNLDLDPEAFCQGVEAQFRELYNVSSESYLMTDLGSECLDIKEVRDGYEELKSNQWRFLQTPGFALKVESDTFGLFELNVKHGVIISSNWVLPDGQSVELNFSPKGSEIHNIDKWKARIQTSVVSASLGPSSDQLLALANKLDNMLPNIGSP